MGDTMFTKWLFFMILFWSGIKIEAMDQFFSTLPSSSASAKDASSSTKVTADKTADPAFASSYGGHSTSSSYSKVQAGNTSLALPRSSSGVSKQDKEGDEFMSDAKIGQEAKKNQVAALVRYLHKPSLIDTIPGLNRMPRDIIEKIIKQYLFSNGLLPYQWALSPTQKQTFSISFQLQ